MALLLSSAPLGCSGFDPSPSDGGWCGGRRKYIPQTASIHALHAIPGATSVASLTPSLDIHVEPFGPQKALLLSAAPTGPHPRTPAAPPPIRRRLTSCGTGGGRFFSLNFDPPSPARLSWFRQPPASKSLSSSSQCRVLHPFEVDSFSQSYNVSRHRAAGGSAGVRGRDAEPGAYRDVFTASAEPPAARWRRIEAKNSNGSQKAKMRIVGI